MQHLNIIFSELSQGMFSFAFILPRATYMMQLFWIAFFFYNKLTIFMPLIKKYRENTCDFDVLLNFRHKLVV